MNQKILARAKAHDRSRHRALDREPDPLATYPTSDFIRQVPLSVMALTVVACTLIRPPSALNGLNKRLQR